MRIGILTFHQSVNNGAVMQAYSLSKKLQQKYPDALVEIIDYRMKNVSSIYSYTLSSYLKSSSALIFAKKCIKLALDPKYLARLRTRTAVFHGCLSKLPLSKKMIIDDPGELVQFINENYDILVVGSDAIWNYLSRGFPTVYLPDAQVTCVKMSYAASCYGMDFLKRPDTEQKQICACLDAFQFIGVRDAATADFVAWSGCKRPTYHTCDPTAFLDVNDLPIDTAAFNKKLSDRGFDFDRPSIAVMGSPQMLKMVRTFYGKQYQIVSLYNYIKGADVNLYDLEPYEWAYVFRYCKLTFTTFFHGTLLSLRNGVPLICIALDTDFSKAHTPKTQDLLSRLGFDDWYFHTDFTTKNLSEIKKKADELLQRDYKLKIIAAMDQEAQSFDHFDLTLKNIMDR